MLTLMFKSFPNLLANQIWEGTTDTIEKLLLLSYINLYFSTDNINPPKYADYVIIAGNAGVISARQW